LKKTLNRFKNLELYPKIALITNKLTDDQINSLHCTADVFVTATHGESFCLPYFDALGFGKPCIVPKHTSFLDYTCEPYLSVDSCDSTVLGVSGAPSNLYSSNELWGNPSLPDLIHKMQTSVKHIEELKTRSSLRKEFVTKNFSYQVIGQKLKETIDAN
jgi:glycosyltransferase involved in cell wall biosynthesis